VSVTDYVIDILLIVVIFRQIRPREVLARLGVLQVRRIGASRLAMATGAVPVGTYADRPLR
jgi:hypothetical protein